MRTSDINQFKGQIKSAIHKWGCNKIDQLFPNKPQIKAFAKNGLNNLLAKYDEKLNKGIDTLMIFAASEDGSIDTDHLIDMSCEMFKEMEPHRYQFNYADIEIGNGKIVFYLPDSMLVDLLFGKYGKFTITTDDVKELKDLLTE